MSNPSEMPRDEIDSKLRSVLQNVVLPEGALGRWTSAIENALLEDSSQSKIGEQSLPGANESTSVSDEKVALPSRSISFRRIVLWATAACLIAAAVLPWLWTGDGESIDRLADRAIQVCASMKERKSSDFREISATNRSWFEKIRSQFRSIEAIDETVVRGRQLGEYWGVVRVRRSDGVMGWMIVRPSEVSKDYGSTFQLVPQRTGGWSVAVSQTSRILVFFVAEGSNRDLERWLHQRQTT